MNTMYKTNAAAALMPAQDKPQLTVVRGIRTRRTSLADELAIHMFGHLNGNDFALMCMTSSMHACVQVS